MSVLTFFLCDLFSPLNIKTFSDLEFGEIREHWVCSWTRIILEWDTLL